jgi:hypothetical protein
MQVAEDRGPVSAVPARTTPVTLALLAAAVGLGYILECTNGHYDLIGIACVLACWVAVLCALFAPARVRNAQFALPLAPVLGAGVLLEVFFLLINPQRGDHGKFDTLHRSAIAVLLLLAVIALGVAWRQRHQPKLQHALFCLVIVLHFGAALITIHQVAVPEIDVWVVEVESARALVHGVNPFSITFPDPYAGASSFFPPGVSVGGRLQFGFVYPPLCLLLCIPGYLLGDPRISTAFAMTLAAVFIARSRPGTHAMLAALLFLFTPRTLFVVHRAWTDSFVVMLTAAVVYCALRKPKYLYVAAGLYCCVKQHMFIGAPALLLLLPQPWSWRQVITFYLKVGAVGLLVTLPLALWDFRAFFNSVLNIREVFRTDSLGLLALLANTGVIHLSKWTGIGAAAIVSVLGLRVAPRTPYGFALLAGTTHFTLYLFSTHAFCNEYYNVIGALCIALAVYPPLAKPPLALAGASATDAV